MKYFRPLFIASIIFLSLSKTVYAAAAGSDDHEGDAFFARVVALEQANPAESHRFDSYSKSKSSKVRLITGEDGLPVAVKKKRPGIYREAFISYLSQVLGLNNVALSKIIKDGSEEFLFEEYVRWRTEGEDPESEAYKIAEAHEQKGSLSDMFVDPKEYDYKKFIETGDLQKNFIMVFLAGLADVEGRNILYKVENGKLRPIIIDTEESLFYYINYAGFWCESEQPAWSYLNSVEEGHAEFDRALRELILSWGIPGILVHLGDKYKDVINIRKPTETKDEKEIKAIVSQTRERALKFFGVKLWTIQEIVRRYAGASIFFLEDLFALLCEKKSWSNGFSVRRLGKQLIKDGTSLLDILLSYKSETRKQIVAEKRKICDIGIPEEAIFKYSEFVKGYLDSLYEREKRDGTPPAVDLRRFIQAYIDQGNDTHAETGEKATVESMLEASAWDIRPIEIEAGAAGAAAAASAAPSDAGAEWRVSLRE